MSHSRRKDELTPATIYLVLGEFTLLRQWFKGCLNLQWTQMFSTHIQELFSIGGDCGCPTACFGVLLRSSFSEGFSASALFNQIGHHSKMNLETGGFFLKEEHV